MQKWISLLLTIVCLFALALADDVALPTQEPATSTGYVFCVTLQNGQEVQLCVDEDFSVLLPLLGEPVSLFESESCAFQGIDRVYTYPSFAVYTYPQEGVDRISSIFLMDDMVETAEGVMIGMDIAQARALYGEPAQEAEGSLTYVQDGCALSLLYDAESCITAITYLSLTANPQ